VRRAECIAMLYPEVADTPVITIMGACAQELYDLGHRDNFFYLQHAMGLASSIGLGLAVHRPEERVVVLDGDGSVLMNLGTLATMARYRPKNLVHIITSNGDEAWPEMSKLDVARRLVARIADAVGKRAA